MKLKIKTKLNLENLLILNVVLFSVVAILHFFRVVTMVPIFIGEYELPVWLNVIAIIFLVFLIWQTWIKTNKSKNQKQLLSKNKLR